jgi:hypothetical protein
VAFGFSRDREIITHRAMTAISCPPARISGSACVRRFLKLIDRGFESLIAHPALPVNERIEIEQ